MIWKAATKTPQKDSARLCPEGLALSEHRDRCVGVVEVTNEKSVRLVSLSELADTEPCVLLG